MNHSATNPLTFLNIPSLCPSGNFLAMGIGILIWKCVYFYFYWLLYDLTSGAPFFYLNLTFLDFGIVYDVFARYKTTVFLWTCLNPSPLIPCSIELFLKNNFHGVEFCLLSLIRRMYANLASFTVDCISFRIWKNKLQRNYLKPYNNCFVTNGDITLLKMHPIPKEGQNTKFFRQSKRTKPRFLLVVLKWLNV